MARFRSLSLRARLIAACLAVELLVLLGVGGFVAQSWHQQQHDQALAQTHELAALLGQAIAAPLAQRDYATVQQLLEAIAHERRVAYLDLHDHLDKPVARAGWPAGKPLPPRQRGSFDLNRPDGTLHWQAPVEVAGQNLGVLNLGLSIGPLREARDALLVRSATIGAVAMALSTALLAVLTLAVTRGLARLSQASLRMAQGRYDTQVPVYSRDELGRLAESFNTMAEQVRRREQALHTHLRTAREERSRLATLLGALHSGIVLLDAQSCVVYANTAFKAQWGLRDNIIGWPAVRVIEHLKAAAPRDSHAALEALLQPAEAQGTGRELEGANARLFAQRVQPLAHGQGGCIWFHRDITEERQLAIQASQARVDPLTGLLNRRGFEASLSRAMASGAPLALITLDLDDFKLANDQGGHQLGDAVLVTVADVLVRAGSEAARLGGDEFALCLCGAAAQSADDVAAQIVHEIRAASFPSRGQVLKVGASVGIAHHPPRQPDVPAAPDAATLLDRADRAMYRAKRQGKNQWAWHAPTAPAPLTGLTDAMPLDMPKELID